jgi:hypothetical protein
MAATGVRQAANRRDLLQVVSNDLNNALGIG